MITLSWNLGHKTDVVSQPVEHMISTAGSRQCSFSVTGDVTVANPWHRHYKLFEQAVGLWFSRSKGHDAVNTRENGKEIHLFEASGKESQDGSDCITYSGIQADRLNLQIEVLQLLWSNVHRPYARTVLQMQKVSAMWCSRVQASTLNRVPRGTLEQERVQSQKKNTGNRKHREMLQTLRAKHNWS